MMLAFVLLRAGDFRRAWRFWRDQIEAAYRDPNGCWPVADPWLGDEDIAGRRVLVRIGPGGDGLGDLTFFWRYVPLLAARGARVSLEVPTKLVRMMEAQGWHGVELVEQGQAPPECDFEVLAGRAAARLRYNDQHDPARSLSQGAGLDVMREKARKRDWVALMVDVDPDELKHCVCKIAFLYVHPNEYRPDGSRTAREAWVRVPGKHKNNAAAWDAPQDLMATRH